MKNAGEYSLHSRHDFDRLRLIRSSNVGPVTYHHLMRRFGDASAALDALPELASRGGGRAPRIAAKEDVEREMESIHSSKSELLFLGDPDYPTLLSELGDAPPCLIWRGNLAVLRRTVIAMVGARNASAAACRFARDLSNGLANSGAAIASGLARGIDTAAHQGSIENTIGVIAGGIDIYYPPENKTLQDEIAERGLLLSEQPPGTEPRARHFPFRNRIIAGLARGTVVVEAAPRSGSLITARLASEAGREVMAVPGSPLDPRSRGCNNLIRDGATLVQSAEDIVELIRPIDDRVEQVQPLQSDSDQSRLREEPEELEASARDQINSLLSVTPVSVDELLRQTGFPASSVQLGLLELELAGRLSRHAGAKVSLKN